MAGSGPDREHMMQQHPPRPPIQSQHSSSVPSTPFQLPRDLAGRFHSTSPSPHRGISNQSPRSVVSEAPGNHNAQRGAPLVCKFETGAEIPKRRIPYVEGGNEELGPPKKEPKRGLQPDDDQKLIGDMRELYSRLLPSDESEDRRARLVKKLERILNDEWPGNHIRVHVFGSSGNLLSSSDSDVDICVTTTLKQLESMHSLAMLLHSHGMEKVVCRASAKVPIVKCWDPELELACDLNVNNTLALENTRMIKTYVQLDPRVRPLAKIIKYWTKRRILNDAAVGGTISSYTWICMVISFLQRRSPSVLPSLQKVNGKTIEPASLDAPHFADDVEALKGCGDANKESLAELFFQFFRHYGYEFKYSEHVVSIREGRLLSRKEKGWEPSNYHDKEAQRRLCVEEPFTTNRNLGNSADDYAWSGIHKEIRRAFELLADGCELEKCCEQYEFPPEEKPVFQKPAPKPAPTLRRSASQSGRPIHEPGAGRSRKGGNRNQSTQRSGNRRASSGAAFSNQRIPLPFQSPPIGANPLDYFTTKGNLHDSLYQQYQYLQAQKDVLRSQLAAQQQQQSQNGQRVADLIGSPHHGQQNRPVFQNGLPSPRWLDSAPPTAPLMPGMLYHYPARYPTSSVPSPISHTRSREGTSTNPSSPSLVAAVPALRRQVHRASAPDGSSSSIRSRSQPGRSLPHPLTLQHQVYPGDDVSGVMSAAPFPNVRNTLHQQQMYTQPPQLPFSPLAAMPPTNQSLESAMPKEYVGYYVGQSPHLGPQQYTTAPQMGIPTGMNTQAMPPMMLHDPPRHRPRRVTPDLMLSPTPNGLHISRSPSPARHEHAYPIAASQVLQSPTDDSLEQTPLPIPSEIELGGPLIVDGSNKAMRGLVADKVNGTSPSPAISENNVPFESVLARAQTLPLMAADVDKFVVNGQPQAAGRPPSPPKADPNSKSKASPRLDLSPSKETPQKANGVPEHVDDHPAHGTAPLLSPVTELRTPSPTRPQSFDKQESPQPNGLVRSARVANAKQSERVTNAENSHTSHSTHERKDSAPTPSKPAKGPVTPTAPERGSSGPTQSQNQNQTQSQNQWQQVPAGGKKGHRKAKSVAAAKANANGLAIPPYESERKGG